MSSHTREKIEPIPLLYRTITKEAPGGGYETALFQVFHDDLQVIGEWLHPEETPPPKVLREIDNIKNPKDGTKARLFGRM